MLMPPGIEPFVSLGLGRAGQGRAGQARTGQDRTRQHNLERGNTTVGASIMFGSRERLFYDTFSLCYELRMTCAPNHNRAAES